MSEEKVKDDLYQRVEEHLQELLEPELPDARLSPGDRLELLEQATYAGGVTMHRYAIGDV